MPEQKKRYFYRRGAVLGTDKRTLDQKKEFYERLEQEQGTAAAWRTAMSEIVAIVMWLIERFGGRDTYNLVQQVADRVADNEVTKGQNNAS
jgi:hypothetical protein